MGAALLALLAAVGAPDRICVSVGPKAPLVETDLAQAMSARAVGKLPIEACGPKARARLSVRVRRRSSNAVAIVLRGRGLNQTRVITIDGLGPQEITQYVAVTAVEAIRPAIDAPADPASSKALDALDEPKCPEPEAVACPEPTTVVKRVPIDPSYRFAVALGPRLGLSPTTGDGYLELGARADAGRIGFGVFTSAAWKPSTEVDGVSLSTWRIGVGTEAAMSWERLRAGVFAQLRLFFVTTSGGAPVVEDGLRWFANGGLGTFFDFTLWSSTNVELGVLAKVWWWPKPDRLLVQGAPVASSSHLEMFAGPRISFGSAEESSSKSSSANQRTGQTR